MLALPEGLENLQKAFGNFLRIENTAGVGGGVVVFSLWCQLPHSKGMKGLRLSFLLSEVRGDGWWKDAEPDRLRSLRDGENHCHVLSR